MAKFLLFMAIIFMMYPSSGWAQSTIYNQSGSGSTTIFNSSSGQSGGGGPLSLKQLLRGPSNNTSTRSSAGSRGSLYYGGQNFRPYGVDSNDYSLSLSPQEINASRARRDRLAQEREQNVLAAIENSRFIPFEEQVDPQQVNQFSGSGAPVQRQIRSKYKQRNDNFELPKKVFNSIY